MEEETPDPCSHRVGSALRLLTHNYERALWEGQDPMVRYYTYRHSVRPTMFFVIRFVDESVYHRLTIPQKLFGSVMNSTGIASWTDIHPLLPDNWHFYYAEAISEAGHVLDNEEWIQATRNPIPYFMEALL